MGARSQRWFEKLTRSRWFPRGLVAALLLAVALVAVFTLPALGSSFIDVPPDYPYAPAIQELATRGIVDGYGDGRFGPEDLVLRQQFAKVILLTLGLPVSEADICSFPDVEISGPDSLYPDNYIAKAASTHITEGKTPSSFAPYDHITRAQVVTMMVRAADNLYPGTLITPPADYQSTWDPAFSPDHGQNARTAEYNGLVAGLPLAELDPWAPMPRGEVAQVLYNLLMKLAPPSTTTTQPPTTTTEPGPESVPIAALKGPEWVSYVGREVTVEGIFVRDPLPMLVTDIDVVARDTRMPEDSYVLLAGAAAEEISSGDLGGALLRVSGRVGLDIPEAASDASLLVNSDYDPAKHVVLTDIDYRVQDRLAVYNPQMANIAMVESPNPDPKRWAVLFSGGIDKANNHARYWNNLKFMYSALVGPLGFSKNNIAVLYADGKAVDSTMPVHYAATEANLATVFDLLREHSRLNDLIFVFTTNHGGGFNTAYTGADCFYGGQLDGDADEPGESLSEATHWVDVNFNNSLTDFFAWDESLNSWQGTSPTASSEIMDDDLQAIFGNLAFNRMVVVMGQCFSGGLIHDLAQGGNRIIMSAAGEHEFAWATSDKSYSEFVYRFTCAVNGAQPNGTPVDADANKDGDVSMVEAFNYARTHDTKSETPWYEDSGDGIPHSGAMPGGGEGTLGANTSLEP